MRSTFFAAFGIALLSSVAMADTPPASTTDLDKPISAYHGYVKTEVDALVSGTKAFTDAIKAGKLKEAQDLYAPTRRHYERIEPIAELFNDLDKSMDAREDDFEKKADDPNFTGFHRIEKTLFETKSTEGLTALADKLMANTVELQKRIADLKITPKAFLGGTAELIEEVASTKISGEEDRYSRTDLWDFQANVDGAQKIVGLVEPTLKKLDPQLRNKIDENFSKVDKILVKYRVKDGFEPYDKLSDKDKLALKGPITELAEDLSKLRGKFGID